ncbi:MAG: LytR/AlgR family response regulator transcription factor [Parvibaculales bacterium]
MISVGILDDERISAEYLEAILSHVKEVEVLGCFYRETEALHAFAQNCPDLIFIDINMPILNGFRFLEVLQSKIVKLPLVVFVSAHTEFALDAFQVKAVDYVLKPFTENRIMEALGRAKSMLSHPSLHTVPLVSREGQEIDKKITQLTDMRGKPAKEKADKLVVKNAGVRVFVDLNNVIWVESDGDYVRFSDGKKVYFIRATLKSMEMRLQDYGFLKIHRSCIVQADKIQRYCLESGKPNYVFLADGSEFPVSRTYRKIIRNLFEDTQ